MAQRAKATQPSLRGLLDSNTNTCRGKWALSDAAHALPASTSDFEFTLLSKKESINNDNNTNANQNDEFPISGKYKGWFDMKTQNPMDPPARYDDNLDLNFESIMGGLKYKVVGNGTNRFGAFNVMGEMDKQGNLLMHRIYAIKKIRRPDSGNGSSSKNKRSALDMNLGSVLSGNREKRTPQPFIKCSDLLRELMKNPAAVWFNDPVDHVKLDIPEYPNIIKKPMCFQDIRNKLDNSIYERPYDFAEDVRLTFNNAIKFNSVPEHHVHIAAKEMLEKFEERYRYTFNLPPLGSLTDAENKKRRLNGNLSYKSNKGPGPRGLLNLNTSGTTGVLAMQRQMKEMQDEIKRLRKSTGNRAKNLPLSEAEKIVLVNSLSKLSINQHGKVMDIIRAALPVGGELQEDGDEYLIPLNDLDDITLNKIKRIVEYRPKNQFTVNL